MTCSEGEQNIGYDFEAVLSFIGLIFINLQRTETRNGLPNIRCICIMQKATNTTSQEPTCVSSDDLSVQDMPGENMEITEKPSIRITNRHYRNTPTVVPATKQTKNNKKEALQNEI